MNRMIMAMAVMLFSAVNCLGEDYYWSVNITNSASGNWTAVGNWKLSGGGAPATIPQPNSGAVVHLDGEPFGEFEVQYIGTGTYDLRGESRYWRLYRNDSSGSAFNPGDMRNFKGSLAFGQVCLGQPFTFNPIDEVTPNRIRMMRSHGAPVITVASGSSVIDSVYGSGKFSKTGAGTLDIGEMSGYSGVRVDAGTVKVHGPALTPVPQMPEGLVPAFHLDASDLSTMTLSEEGGRKTVTEWRDKNGAAKKAGPWGEYPLPFLNEDYASNKAVVDFGPRMDGTDASKGMSMLFNGIGGVKEVIVVACDTDELKPIPYFNNGGGGNYYNGRGTKGEVAVPVNRSASYAYASAFARGHVYLDGYSADNVWELNGRGLHVLDYDFSDTGSAYYSTLCNERSVSVGGGRIAEIMFFTSHLTAQQRADIAAYLKAKWFDASEAGHYQAEELTVQNAGTLDVEDGTFRAHSISAPGGTFVKTGSGTLATDRVDPSVKAISVQGGSVAFTGSAVMDETPTLPDDPYLHLDASDPIASHFVTETDASSRTRVTRWQDVRGEGHPDAHQWTKTNLQPGPILLEEELNGKPVLDFGLSTTINTKAAEDAGTLEIKSSSGSEFYYREGFYVAKYPTSSAQRGHILGGESADYSKAFHFMPGSPALLSSNFSGAGPRGAYWTMDGTSLQPLTDPVDSEYHVFRFSIADKIAAEAIATDRANSIGGFKLAELVLYSRKLTDKERINAEAYLMKKWLPAKSHPYATPSGKLATLDFTGNPSLANESDLSVGVLSGSGSFSKSGSGDLDVSRAVGKIDGLTVGAGSLAVGSISTVPGAWFHVDASDAKTLTTQVVEGVTYVTSIADADGGEVSAAVKDSEDYVNLAPTLVKDDAALKPYLDFGAPTSGRWLKWSKSNENVRDVVLVMAVQDKNSWFLGYDSGAIYDFHRDTSNGALLNNSSAVRFYQSYCTVDGVEQVPTSYKISSDIHVVTLSLTNSASAGGRVNDFANDRGISGRIGGLKLCEAYVFSELLTDAQRKELVARLTKKWTDPAQDMSGAVSTLSTFTVADGASFSLDDDLAIADNATVTAGGTVSIAGQLSLGASVSVTYDGDPVPGEYELFSAGSLSGVENLGTWTLANAIAKYPYKFVLRNGKVVLEVSKLGMLLIVR